MASPAGYALSTYRPVLSNHLGQEQRFRTPDLLKKYGIERAINVPIRGALQPFGVLEADSTEGDDFIESDLVFLEGISNVISMAVERLANGADEQLPDRYSESMLNASPDCVKILTTHGDIEFMNDAGMYLMHISELAEVRGKPWTQLWPDDSKPVVRDAMARSVPVNRRGLRPIAPRPAMSEMVGCNHCAHSECRGQGGQADRSVAGHHRAAPARGSVAVPDCCAKHQAERQRSLS